jgi:peptide/nickel transport system substrate-binding protein
MIRFVKRWTLFAIIVVVVASLLLVVVRTPPIPGRGSKAETQQIPDQKYSESPMLRERVERGELPPVDERLPDEPLVLTPPEAVGRYSSDP